MKNKYSGKFIALDGPDGCGKSTQAKLLAEWLKGQDAAVESFRDPGDTAIGEKIREVLLNPEHIAMSTATEVLLYMAARAQLWGEKIAPALMQKKCVILDRWLSSTCAYQGYAGGFGINQVIKLAADSLKMPWPDLTIILDVDLETSANRLSGRPDRMEAKPRQYHQKVREGFLELVHQQKNFLIVDATGEIETVHKKVIEVVEKMF
ncbi:MAG: dTMP kinase [Planctomycetes bacterium]|nr:dTMP kinase [Planctomycetota bacterium]